MSLSPKIWGHCFWQTLVYIVISYPAFPSIEQQYHYKRFFYELGNVLPCERCQINFSKHIEQVPIDNYLNNREALFEWLLIMYNLVNRSLNKPLITQSTFKKIFLSKLNGVVDDYTEITTMEGFSNKQNSNLISIIIMGIILLVVFGLFLKLFR